MKNILIPTDFSENAWNAIEYALHFFSKKSCNFYLLHVDTPDALSDDELLFGLKDSVVSQVGPKTSKKHLFKTLNRIHDVFPKNHNHNFYSVIDKNSIIDSIRKHVDQKKIDFIVMGTKGVSGLKKTSIGKNAGNVITRVKCTTMVIPENAKYKEPKEIAFPTDFSFFYPTETLKPLEDIIQEYNAAIRVVHLNKSDALLNEDQKKNKEFLDDYFNDYEHSFHFLTNEHIDDSLQKFVETKNVSIITMLAKNLNYFQKILFHPSVSNISYYTDIPFLVLH